MSMDRRLWRSVIAVLLVVLTLLVATTIPDANADPKPKILPLEASPYGNTHGEWTAQWWQWLMAIPEATNPNFDTTVCRPRILVDTSLEEMMLLQGGGHGETQAR
jgi:hypothetical protein